MFRKYNHVERLGSEEVDGLLDSPYVFITPKIDGTNSSVFWDEENECVGGGSRTRALTLENDNAGFYKWLLDTSLEAQFLRNFVSNNQNLIVYGEWLGDKKFIGSIKVYDENSKSHLWLFDVYNRDTESYLPDAEWRELVNKSWVSFLGTKDDGPYPYYVPFERIENPTEEKLKEKANDNKFLLAENANRPGEGLVIRYPDFRSKFGNYEIGKLVLDEYKRGKHNRPKVEPGCVEEQIINEYVTDAECAKSMTKIELATNENFSTKNGKQIGMYLNEVWNGAIVDEMKTILKKTKMPTINFKTLRHLCDDKARSYIKL